MCVPARHGPVPVSPVPSLLLSIRLAELKSSDLVCRLRGGRLARGDGVPVSHQTLCHLCIRQPRNSAPAEGARLRAEETLKAVGNSCQLSFILVLFDCIFY